MSKTFPLSAVRLTQGFWKDKQHLIRSQTVPHLWAALNDRVAGAPKSGAIHNLRLAAGDETGDFVGLVSQDSDLFKWMEAASYALALEENEGIRGALEDMADLLERAQRADGYLNAFYQLYHPEEPWAYLKESCQLYCAGHMIEAGVAHYEATGSLRLLKVAMCLADRVDADFGREAGKLRGYDGHAEIELALMRLYHATGEKRYLERARYFIEERGQQPFYFDLEREQAVQDNLVYALKEADYHHSQSHAPIRDQLAAKGHAVKAMYFYSGVCDVALETGDESLLHTLRTLWDSVMRQMYVTGAIGSSEHGERFTVDYDLPNDLVYGETCASIGLFLFAFRMLLAKPKGEYADVMERALYNGILSGLSLDGKAFFYTNPLECDPVVNAARFDRQHLLLERQPWFECPCCPPNIARLVGSLGRYVYTASEDSLYVHHYLGSTATLDGLTMTQETNYPWEGSIALRFSCETPLKRRIALRLPGWSSGHALTMNGASVQAELLEGYLTLERVWQTGDVLGLELPMEPRRVYVNPKVRADEGKACLSRGPIIYCAETQDQKGGSLDGLFLAKSGEVREENRSLGGVPFVGLVADALQAHGPKGLYSYEASRLSTAQLRLIPYSLWANRGPQAMRVFFPERSATE